MILILSTTHTLDRLFNFALDYLLCLKLILSKFLLCWIYCVVCLISLFPSSIFFIFKVCLSSQNRLISFIVCRFWSHFHHCHRSVWFLFQTFIALFIENILFLTVFCRPLEAHSSPCLFGRFRQITSDWSLTLSRSCVNQLYSSFSCVQSVSDYFRMSIVQVARQLNTPHWSHHFLDDCYQCIQFWSAINIFFLILIVNFFG